MSDEPDEILTVANCPGCEQPTLAGDLEAPSPGGTTGGQLVCPRCGTRIDAGMFYDYVDVRVVEYE